MPLKIVHPDHFEIVGNGHVLLSSPPTTKLTADLSVGSLTEEIALLSKGHAIIGKETKSIDQPLVESAASDYYASAATLSTEQDVRFVLELYGRREPGIEIKVDPSLVPEERIELVRIAFAVSFEVKVTLEASIALHRYSTKSEPQIVVLEFGPVERTVQRDSVIASVADVVGLINGKIGALESDKGPGDALD